MQASTDHLHRCAEIDAAYVMIRAIASRSPAHGLRPLFVDRRDQIIALSARRAIPTVYETRESVAAGGLMSYGTSLTNGYRQVDIYTDESSKVISPLTYGRAP